MRAVLLTNAGRKHSGNYLLQCRLTLSSLCRHGVRTHMSVSGTIPQFLPCKRSYHILACVTFWTDQTKCPLWCPNLKGNQGREELPLYQIWFQMSFRSGDPSWIINFPCYFRSTIIQITISISGTGTFFLIFNFQKLKISFQDTSFLPSNLPLIYPFSPSHLYFTVLDTRYKPTSLQNIILLSLFASWCLLQMSIPNMCRYFHFLP